MAERPKSTPLPEGVEREVTERDSAALSKFMSLCLQQDVRFLISFDTGRFVPGRFILENDEIQAQHVVQGPQGITIEVGDSSYRGTDGTQKLYPTIGEAVQDGLQILFGQLSEKKGKDGATKVFQQFFTVDTSNSD